MAECVEDERAASGSPTRLAWGAEFRARIEQFWPGVDPRRVVLDITPGSKEMSLAMVLDAACEGNHLLYIRQTWRGSERIPGEETPILLAAPKR